MVYGDGKNISIKSTLIKISKVFFCCLLILMEIKLTIAAGGFSSDVNIDFENMVIFYSGISGNYPTKSVNAVVVSGENEPDGNNVIGIGSTLTGMDGEYSGEIHLSRNTAPGIYKVFIDSEHGNKSKRFIVINEIESQPYLTNLNSKLTESEFKSYLENNSEKFGLFSEDYAESFSFAAGIVFSLKPTGGYISSGTVNSKFYHAVSIYYVKNSDSVSDTLKNNEQILGIDFSKYKNLDSKTKEYLDSLLKNADYQKEEFSKIYDECLIFSEIKTADRWTVQKDKILKYKSEIGFNTTKYALISNKDLVFQTVFKNNIAEFADIKIKVDSAIDECYLLEQNGTAQTRSVGSAGGGGGGGFVNVNPETVTNVNKSFSDTYGHWANQYIDKLVQKGVISGYEDGTFKPDNTITRAEFVKIIVCAFELEGKSENKYSDVNRGEWYSDYISKAGANNIIFGSDGKFFPNNNITREDAVVIIYRILKSDNFEKNDKSIYSDENNISEYAKEAVSNMSGIGIIHGYEGMFLPHNPITRAEATTIIALSIDR